MGKWKICPEKKTFVILRKVVKFYAKLSTENFTENVKQQFSNYVDFCFLLTGEEFELVKIFDQFHNIKHSSVLPKAFTHLGCNMLATILKSEVAVRRCVQIIRAFTMLEEGMLPGSISGDRNIIKAIVNELAEIRRELARNREEMQRQNGRWMEQNKRLANIEASLQEMRDCLVHANLPAPPKLLPPLDWQSSSDRWISSRQAQLLRKLGKEKGKTRNHIAQMWSEFKSHFDLDRYIHLPKERFQEALEWLKAWNATKN